MNVDDAKKATQDFIDSGWKLTPEQIKKYKSFEYKPYNTWINASKHFISKLEAAIKETATKGETQITRDLFNISDFQGWQCREIAPYIVYYFKDKGFEVTRKDTTITVKW